MKISATICKMFTPHFPKNYFLVRFQLQDIFIYLFQCIDTVDYLSGKASGEQPAGS